jgi:cell division ATPase FtsA
VLWASSPPGLLNLKTLEILDVEMLEHQERSMIGGQIHDIPRVAGTVSRIKRTFEE